MIPAEDFSKLIEANEIIEKALEDKKKLLDKTEKQCKTMREEAKKEGFEEGLLNFNKQVLSMDEALKTLRLSLQQMVIPIALKAAKKIVGKELETFPETIVDIVMQAIAPISQSHQVTIFVSKEDKEILEKEKAQIAEILEHIDIFKIEEDPELKQGECKRELV